MRDGRGIRIGLVVCLIGAGGLGSGAGAGDAPPPPANLRFVNLPVCEHGCGLGALCTETGCACPEGTTGDPDVVCESPTCPASCDLVAGCDGDGACLPCPPGYVEDDGICEPVYELHLRQFDLSNERHLRYYANHALDTGSADVVRAVLVVHGTDRDADVYYRRLWEAAAEEEAQHRTLIVAPWFRIADDGPAPDEAFWEDNSGWKEGDASASPAISSFRVLDEMLEVLHARVLFPNLRQIIVTGHSAGGQYVQRFGLASPIEGPPEMLPPLYAPANAGSYAYVDGERLLEGGTFGVPTGCAGYNEWKYGLDDPNPYVAQRTPAELRAAYRERQVVYLLGAEDDDPDDDLLDVSCAAMLQGDHRLERGLRFVEHLEQHYASPVHEAVVVPGVGHSASALYDSALVRALFF
jgi:hypothetical protein